MQRHLSHLVRAAVPFALIALTLITAFSCATAPPVQTEEDVRAVTALAAAGENEILTQQSYVPFLFDGEILGRGQDVAEMWRLVVRAGLFDGGVIVRSLADAGPETYKLFADSKQVEFFFSKYLSEYAQTAVLETPAATVTLLLDGKSEGYSRIAGMKVDVR